MGRRSVVRAGAVRAIPFTRQGYKRTWSAATLKDVARVPHVRDFIQLVVDHPPFASPTRRPAHRRTRTASRARGRHSR